MCVRAGISVVGHAQGAGASECVQGEVGCGTHRKLGKVSACRERWHVARTGS